MKKIIISCIVVFGIIGAIVFAFASFSPKTILGIKSSQGTQRQVDQIALNVNQVNQPQVNVPASKLPEFTIDLTSEKFKTLLAVSKQKLAELVQANIAHVYAAEPFPTDVTVDQQKSQLIVHPHDIPNFKPGMYKLSLKLRTLEGDVNIEQDFTWGVIAVNTNKSIYKPGETAKIGIGVLNDRGETLCTAGEKHVDDLTMTITDPQGNPTNFSIDGQTITDSGRCGANTVTNYADFQAKFPTTSTGIYQMTVSATVAGEKRTIKDYFKVDESVAFDVERTSFPTRIYPRSPYPVTFTVTAKNDYYGTVEDIVPASFSVGDISDHGRLERDGNFIRIIWNVNLAAGVSKDFTYFIHFPQISPEFYLLGPITIGSFKEARQWQIASDTLNSTSGIVSYENNNGNQTFSRVWTGTTWNPALTSVGTTMSTTPTDSRWFREVASPQTGEKIVALIDNTTADTIYVFTWDGSSWNGGTPSVTIALTGVTTADATRPFDIAYEENSGDALLVYSDYTNAQLLYRKRPKGGSWDSSSSNAGSAFDVFKRWIRLQPKFNSNKILVGYLNNNEQVGAMIWDGDTQVFGDQFSDASGTTAATSADQSFDIAWETSNGNALIFWGISGASHDIIYREFTGSTWSSETTGITGFTNNIDWLFAEADPSPTSNYIAIATQELTTPACRSMVWNGTSILRDNNSVPCASAATNNLIDTAFENDTSRAMWVMIPATNSAEQMSWKTWTPASGFSTLTTEAGATTTAIEGIQLYSDLNTTTMLVLYHDNSGTGGDCELWDREWDGDTNTWTAKGTNPLHDRICASGDNDTEPYGFGFDRNLEKLVAYKWFDNNPTSLGGSGGSALTALADQDNPFTLTSANQEFRLRFLLYYPDSLLTSSARAYKLQYVDPGSGTCANPSGGTPSGWTDVGTGGSTLISFNDNGSLNDKAPIATQSAGVDADPSYSGSTTQYQNYIESNTFTNGRTNMLGGEVGIWDASLIDNTTYDRASQTFCFRVARSNDLVLQISIYPKISTASIPDVMIKGGTLIQGGTKLQ